MRTVVHETDGEVWTMNFEIVDGSPDKFSCFRNGFWIASIPEDVENELLEAASAVCAHCES